MNAVVPIRPGNAYSPAQIQLIRRTVANDCNDNEFDLFITVARMTGLDPFRKQIHALVFSKDKPEKRKMAIVTAIDGMRAIAARSLRYRPDEDEPVFEYDEALKNPLNPLGLVKAVVNIYMRDEGGETWRRVPGVAYWDEFAPLKDEWGEHPDTGKWGKTGRQTLDGNWPKMGRLMLAKCAEAQAIRKAFPEDLSSIYERAEFDRAMAEDLTPSELVEAANVEHRLKLIGGKDCILFQMQPGGPLQNISLGQIADRVVETVRAYLTIDQLDWFESVNRAALQDFWARAKADALDLKRVLEARRAELTGPSGEAA